MVYAAMERCPVLGGKVQSFDAKGALAVPGVLAVAPITGGLSPGVAVVANNTWTAMKGREALKIVWDRGPHQKFDSEGLFEEMHAALAQDGYIVRNDGNAPSAMASASNKLQAIYEFPPGSRASGTDELHRRCA